MKRLAPILLFLFLFTLPAGAAPLKPSQVIISVKIPGSGTVLVEEHYFFPKTLENNLIALSGELGSRYSLWKGYVDGLSFHVCEQPVTSRLVLKVMQYNKLPELILYYECNTAKSVEHTFLYDTYELSSFTFPLVGGLMTLPSNYVLEVNLDMGKIVDVKPEPSQRSDRFVSWRGPLSTAQRFYIKYRIPRIYLVPSVAFSLASLMEDPRSLIILTALLILAYVGREKIKEKVVQWVSSTTDIVKE